MNAEFVKFDDICAKNYSLAEYNFLFFNILLLNHLKQFHVFLKKDFYSDFKKEDEENYWLALISFDDTEFVILKRLNESQSYYKGKSLHFLIEDEALKNPESFHFLYNKKEDVVFYKNNLYLMLSVETMSQLFLLNEYGTHSGDFYLYIEENILNLKIIVSSNNEKNVNIRYDIKGSFNKLTEFEKNISVLFKGYHNFGFKYCMYLSYKNNNQNYKELIFSDIDYWLKEKRTLMQPYY